MFLGLGIGDFPNPKNTNYQLKITNMSFYHQVVISISSSLLVYGGMATLSRPKRNILIQIFICKQTKESMLFESVIL